MQKERQTTCSIDRCLSWTSDDSGYLRNSVDLNAVSSSKSVGIAEQDQIDHARFFGELENLVMMRENKNRKISQRVWAVTF